MLINSGGVGGRCRGWCLIEELGRMKDLIQNMLGLQIPFIQVTVVPKRHQEVVRSVAWRCLGAADTHVGSTASSFPHTSVSLCNMG